MPTKVTKEDGTEVEAFLPEEVEAQKAELEAAQKEVEALRRVSAEKTENFKKLNEMTEAERATFSAKEIENMKRIEAAESRATALEGKINEDTKTRVENDTKAALERYHGGDPKLKEALEKNFKIINLEGTDTETINERARLAASMYTGQSGRPNPLMSPMNGSSPMRIDQNKTDEFLKSDKAKKAYEMMGMTEDGKLKNT